MWAAGKEKACRRMESWNVARAVRRVCRAVREGRWVSLPASSIRVVVSVVVGVVEGGCWGVESSPDEGLEIGGRAEA